MKCKCGCGKEFEPSYVTLWRINRGEDVGYIRGHWVKGERNHNWIGGRVHDSKGYVFLLMPEHPNARKNGYVNESHYVMSKHLGRPIDTSKEVVHHINGVKDDNHIKNLFLTTKNEHTCSHTSGSKNVNWKGGLEPKQCPTCGKWFVKDPGNHKRDTHCSQKCVPRSGESHWKARLTEDDVRAIRRLHGKRRRREVAIAFGVSESQIKKIWARNSWKHI
jgi:hypothetical protein